MKTCLVSILHLSPSEMCGASSHTAVTGHYMVCCHLIWLPGPRLSGRCIQIMKYLGQALCVLCRGGLSQAHPAPWVAAVPRRMRELPFSSSPYEQPVICALTWWSHSEGQEELIQVLLCLPTDFAQAELCLRGA